LLLFAGCGGKSTAIPAGTPQPDKFLFDRGNEALKEQDWMKSREYFQRLVDNYPQSPFRADAKLGVGDTYLGEGSAESAVLAANEFREFLSFYPTNPRADYAQYKLAMSHARQMRAPERDQTETRAALKEFDLFFERYPNSALAPEVKQRWREARDRLSEASYRVGIYYYRSRWYPGAIDRFREVLRDDPGFSSRDAVYFYLAESLAKTDKKAEAIPYFERIVKEFEQSQYLDDAQKRLQELKNQ
jgi:outer membrane protein assembly factor BamD